MQPRYTNLRDTPAPKKEYVLDYSNICGGINLWDPDYRLKPNESPEIKNLLWRNGMLCSRKGQAYVFDTALGQGYAAYPRFWHGCIFAHIGDGIYCFRENEMTYELLCTGVPAVRGTFFTYPNFAENEGFGQAMGGIVAGVYLHVVDPIHNQS